MLNRGKGPYIPNIWGTQKWLHSAPLVFAHRCSWPLLPIFCMTWKVHVSSHRNICVQMVWRHIEWLFRTHVIVHHKLWTINSGSAHLLWSRSIHGRCQLLLPAGTCLQWPSNYLDAAVSTTVASKPSYRWGTVLSVTWSLLCDVMVGCPIRIQRPAVLLH